MDKRLEEIKNNAIVDKVHFKYINNSEGYWGITYTLIDDDMRWLVDQAERVQELEKDNKRLKDLNSNNLPVMRSMHEKTERYKQALENILEIENDEEFNPYAYMALEIMEEVRKALYECSDCNGTGYDHSRNIPDHMTPCFKCRGYGTLKGVEG
ncbi:DnaJ-like cysteine-rich domain-containing protein [Virgibacillus salexigens]|uniref:Uncharacterized protein n=1 Tax=Virgibacillus massiliensis TaxID=1462526 RepID=A0A024QI70_9BACI|nr:hypothetical protein [Virgibacillus massiliensis]CDQ41885.1 hypothetical protein BN990_04264 [Virgibacillus massiliensis]